MKQPCTADSDKVFNLSANEFTHELRGGSRGGVMGVATPPFGLGPDHFISSAAASIAKDKSC